MHPTWCMALVADEELFQSMAVLILAEVIPSLSDGRGKGGDDVKILWKGGMSRHWMVGETRGMGFVPFHN